MPCLDPPALDRKDHAMAVKPTRNSSDFVRRAFAPAARLNEVVAGNVERIAKFQHEWIGDLLQLGLDQMNAAVKARDLATLLAQQHEITTRFVARAQSHQATLTDIAAAAQAGFLQWAEDATSLATGKSAA